MNRRHFFSLAIGSLIGSFLPKPKNKGFTQIATFGPSYGDFRTATVWQGRLWIVTSAHTFTSIPLPNPNSAPALAGRKEINRNLTKQNL